MKKLRSVSLNHAFIALVGFSIISMILFFFGKQLTSSVHFLPYDFKNGNYFYYEIPQLSIFYLITLGTLLVFHISYLRNLYIQNTEVFIFGTIVGTIAGTIAGTALGTVFGTIVGPIVGTVFGTIVGTVFGTIVGTIVGTIGGTVFGTIVGTVFGTIVGTVNIFFFLLFHSSLGIIEITGYTLLTGVLLFTLNGFLQSILPLSIAIVERIFLIIKSPAFTGRILEKKEETTT